MDTTTNPPPGPSSDLPLWAAVQAGDADAFAAVFDRHSGRVHRHALRWASASDADDLVASAFLEAWRRRGDVTLVDGSVLPWLLATVNHLQRNRARSGRRAERALLRLRAADASTSPDHADDVAARLDAAEQARAVRAALARMDPLAQDVVTLCILEGHSQAAAAELLGCAVGTVKSRLSRARTRLRRALAEAGHDPAPRTAATLTPPFNEPTERIQPCAP